ncbi:Mic26p RNJ42_00983 [Nakaseomyces bracarensis]|uniref:Mic26p n=1 Tax=Nakaseomyces bracarensis TaxID=273131 RepID=UPI0038726298
MGVDFYREVDLVKEQVVPPEGEIVPSSQAKEAVGEPVREGKDVTGKLSRKFVKLIGDNELVDGISVRNPPYMVKFFERNRTRIASKIDKATEKVERASKKYYDNEYRITSTVAGLRAEKKEEFIPGLTYTAVAFMSGSVLTRNKNILYRLTAPLILGTTCLAFVLPGTFTNVKKLCHDIEKKNFPAFTAQQDRIYNRILSGFYRSVDFCSRSYKSVNKSLDKAQNVVQDWTGLNVEKEIGKKNI